MATTFWAPNASLTAQVETATVTAVANGATLTATHNAKALTYVCTSIDTVASATTALYALLASSAAPSEFGEISFTNPSAGVITATARTPGTPFANLTGGLVFSAAGGAAVTQVHTTANSSPSDVTNANNWNRAGSAAIPVNGDDVVIANSAVPLLWNLAGLSAVQFASYTRWQDFTAAIGLPENNPGGYPEWRATYFKFTSGGTLTMELGHGTLGSGPVRERYDVGATPVILNAFRSGSAADAYAVRFLGSNAANVLNVLSTSVAVAMLPGETATVASATVDGGGALALGSGVTFSGALAVTGGTAVINCATGALTFTGGAALTMMSSGATYASVTIENGSTANWLSNSGIAALVLAAGSTFSKASDPRAITIVNSTIDGDTCFISDPLNAIAYTNATLVRNAVNSGPFVVGPNRSVRWT